MRRTTSTIPRGSVLQELSVERLQSLLSAPTEGTTIDFKESLSLSSNRGIVEFAKDVLAFANSGGGHMIIGVRDGRPPRDIIGLPQSDLPFFTESKRINDSIRRYTGGFITVSVATHAPDLSAPDRLVGMVYVPGRTGRAEKVPAQHDGSYPNPASPEKQIWTFRRGDVYIRKGDQSCKVETPEDLIASSPSNGTLPVRIAEDVRIVNPYDVAAAASKLMFKGREREIEMLLDSIESGTHTAVFGLQRIGKTSLVKEVLSGKLHTRPKLEDRVLYATLDFQRLGNEYTYRTFLDSLVQAIANNVPNVSAKEVSNHIATFASQYERGSKREMLIGFSTLLDKLAYRARKRIAGLFLFENLCPDQLIN